MAERCFETVRTTFSIVSVPSCLVIDTRGAFRLLGPRRLPFSPETQPGKSRCFIMPIRNERNIVRCGSFSPRNEPVINPLEKKCWSYNTTGFNIEISSDEDLSANLVDEIEPLSRSQRYWLQKLEYCSTLERVFFDRATI